MLPGWEFSIFFSFFPFASFFLPFLLHCFCFVFAIVLFSPTSFYSTLQMKKDWYDIQCSLIDNHCFFVGSLYSGTCHLNFLEKQKKHIICLCFINKVSYYRHNFELSLWICDLFFNFSCSSDVLSLWVLEPEYSFICWDFHAGGLYALEHRRLFLLYKHKIKNICPDLIKKVKHPEAMGQIIPSNLW